MSDFKPLQSTNPHYLVDEFHYIFGHPRRESPSTRVPEKQLRLDLIEEEFKELIMALNFDDVVETADALADLVYVIYGAALVFGIDLPKVLQEVHDSNMSKLDPNTGRPIYREDGKILKGSAYKAPNIARVLGI